MKRKPNIILITIDCLRADYCGWLNSKHKLLTPFLNKLADESTVFTHAYATGPFTGLAIPSILTGTYTLESKNSEGKIPIGINKKYYLPEILQNNGYFNVFVHDNPFLSKIFGYDRGFNIFKDLGSFYNKFEMKTKEKIFLNKKYIFFEKMRSSHWYEFLKNILIKKTPKIYYFLKFIVYYFLKFNPNDFFFITSAETINKFVLDERKNIKNPFFLWIHYLDLHEPYQCPNLPPENIFSIISKNELKRINQKGGFLHYGYLTKDDKHLIKNLYKLNLRYIDREIERLFDNFKNELENSIIIIVADHGQEFGEYSDWGHIPSEENNKLHEETLHVPLLIKIPNRNNEIINKTVSCAQIPATILQLIGIKPHREMELSLFSDKKIRIYSESVPLPMTSFLGMLNEFDVSRIKRVDISNNFIKTV